MMVGRLKGSLDGRPMVLIANGQDVILELGLWINLLRFRRFGRSSLSLMIPVLTRLNLRFCVRFGPFGTIELFPKKNRLLALLLPTH